MELGPQQLGKWLIGIGLAIAAFGLVMILVGRLGLFRLPGDFELEGRNWRIHLPLATSLVLSLILTLVLWLIRYLRR